MSTIRTFFWHDRVKSRSKLYWDRHCRGKPWNDFLHGNAGDVFTRDVLSHFYPDARPVNLPEGPRILCVGSIAHKVKPGDVLCGIGCKTAVLPAVSPQSIYIHALRGPISHDIFKAAGYDVSGVRFLADPGLLISEMVPEQGATKGNVIFIPHYRERELISRKVPSGMRIVDIDNPPLFVAGEIQRAECVYSSSLHGIIFAHALKRPCVFVRPATEESSLKFEDYFLSVGINPPTPLDSIADAKPGGGPISPARLSIDVRQIEFPSAAQLTACGVIR
jgi:pyruvyltransferase